MPWIFNFGTSVLSDDWTQSDANDPRFVAACRWLRDLIWEHKITPVPSGMALNFLAAGKVAMTGAGRWPVGMYENMEFYDYDIVYYPKAETQITEYGIHCYSIMSGSKYPDETWELLKYLCSKEFRRPWAIAGVGIPARRSLALDPEVMGPYPAHWRLFWKSLVEKPVNPVPSPPEYNQIAEIWTRYFSAMASGAITAEEAATGTHKEISAVLEVRER